MKVAYWSQGGNTIMRSRCEEIQGSGERVLVWKIFPLILREAVLRLLPDGDEV